MKIIGEEEEIVFTEESDESEETYNLIDSKVIRKELINKILIIIVLGTVVVVSSCIAGIMIAKAHNDKAIAEYYSIMEDNLNEVVDQTEEIIEETNTLPNPVYGENAKNRMETIYELVNEEKIAYLTFDDGPSSSITPQILQILEEEGVKATFFVLGSRVELLPDMLKKAYEAGHYIGNHGYSHDYARIYSSPTAVLDEYNRTEAIIKNAIGNENYNSYLFRFPGGSEGGKYKTIKEEAKALLHENNIAYINWNTLTNDAVGHPTAESIVNDLKAGVQGKNSIVVLMHDTGTKQLTADTLRENIQYLREQGYTFKNFYDIMCE